MLHVMLILADTILIADRETDGTWHVKCQDNHSGKSETATWTDAQFNAVTVLALGAVENGEPGYNAELLYSVVEPLFTNWAREVRPVP